MPKIAIITDTDSSLPVELAARYGIHQVPITIHFGAESFETGVDIDDVRTFSRIDREGKLPTTAAPAPGRFVEAFRAAFDAGAETVLCFCVSAEVSRTYDSAQVAAAELPGRDIVVVDTRSLSMGFGFSVLAAAEAAQAGAGKEEVLVRAEDVVRRTHLYTALATLKYLAMSGRVGHLAAGMASLLSIKPILTVRDGKLDMLERVRTRGKAWARVVELAVETAAGRPVERAAILHVNALEEARDFAGQLRAGLALPDELLYGELTPGLSVHAGAGLVGVAFVVGK
jgi:DegV family protein with EDD domain